MTKSKKELSLFPIVEDVVSRRKRVNKLQIVGLLETISSASLKTKEDQNIKTIRKIKKLLKTI